MLDEQRRGHLVAELVDAMGRDNVFREPADLVPYSRDTFPLLFSREDRYLPDVVVTPTSTREVVAAVKIAHGWELPVIPKGGGSSRTGMLVPTEGGMVLDTIKLNRLIRLDRMDMLVKVQAGINLQELEMLLRKQGLTLGHEQGSQKIATVGGAISTAAYSRKNQKYGNIWERIASLEVVLGDGSVLKTGPDVPYSSAGVCLSAIFVGAEGTLGVITEATLRVQAAPERTAPMLALFREFAQAREAAQELMGSGLSFMGGTVWEDERGLSSLGHPEHHAAMLLAFEGTAEESAASELRGRRIVEQMGGTVLGEDIAGQRWRDFTVHWCGKRAATGNEDVIVAYVPRSREEEYFRRLLDDILPRHGLVPLPGERRSFDFGGHMILSTRFAITPDDAGWRAYISAVDEVSKLISALSGTIAACHGVGLLHRSHASAELGEEYVRVYSEMKRILDPRGIMNPGKKLP